MEDKDFFYIKLRTELATAIPVEKVEDVINVVSLVLSQYDIQEKPHELIVYDGGDTDLMQAFFIAKASEGLTEKTLKFYRFTYEKAFSAIGKHIKDITTEDLRAYLTKLRLSEKKPVWVDNVRRNLSSFFGWLRREGLLEKDPCERIHKIKSHNMVERAFTEDELEKIRIGARSLRDKAIVEFLYSTACRVNEVTTLNRSDIDFDNGRCQVLGKGKKYRWVYLSSRCKTILAEYLKSRSDDNPALFVSDYSNWKGHAMDDRPVKRIENDRIRDIVKAIGKRVGVQGVHPHRFRKTAATHALFRGMKITDVQRMLGHADLKTTTIYALTDDEEVQREHRKYIM